MSKTGVLIGRFQTASVDDRLRRFIETLKSDFERFIIVVGVSKLPPSANNPFSKKMRTHMLSSAFPDAEVLTLDDHPLDEVWSQNLDELISLRAGDGHPILLGSEDNFVRLYSGRFRTKPTGKSVNPEVDPKQLESADSEAFRDGVLWAVASAYPKVNATVDIAVFRNGHKELLLGFKEADKKWRLPGGFTDPDDESFEASALRELKEETGLNQVGNLTFEGSFRIDDWRYRQERDKIITTLYSTTLTDGSAAANDDIAELKWFTLDEIRRLQSENKTAREHEPLFKVLLQRYAE